MNNFIWMQYALFDRVAADENEITKVKITKDQLLPHIQEHFLVVTPNTVRELADAARRIAKFTEINIGTRLTWHLNQLHLRQWRPRQIITLR